jgi:hypothetical protein
MSPEKYARLPRDSKRENETCKWLRQQEEVKKFEFVWKVYRINPSIGLVLIKKSQLKPIFLEAILEHGFVYGDASSVESWLEATIEGLGHKKVVAMVKNHISDAPLVVFKVLYFLPHYCQKHTELFGEIKNIRNEFERLYPNFSSTRSTGIHATGE